MQTRTETLQTKKRRSRKSPRGKILTLKERLLAIKAYYRKPVYSKIAKRFKCDWEQIKTIIKERKAILDYYEMAKAHVDTLTNEEILMRRQKITLLGGCMYEYIQRSQYHKNAMLDEKVLLAQAAEFSYFLQIKNFFPTKSWLKQFKISYKIPLTVKQIELNRIPPVSLNPKKIMAHCKRLVKTKNGQTKNNPQADSDSQAENNSTSTKTSKTTKGHTTVESESRKQRRQKINLLERALYEFIQRAQFHRNAPLNEDLHIKIACELNDMLNIENFTPNKNWIKHFKLHFNINTSQRKIVVNRIPPYSLNLNDILSYCSDKDAESSNTSATIPTELEHKATEIVEKVDENQQPKIILNSRVQPENIMTLEFHNVGEVDIKPDISDIEIEFVEADEEMEQPALKIRKIESMHIDKINTEESANTSGHDSSEEDIKPDITDIEYEILDVDDDKEVEQPALKIRKIETMHVDNINTKELANGCSHNSDEEDIKPNISDIEFELLNDDDADKEVEQPDLQMQEFESIQVEPSTESQQRSDNEKTPSKHDANDCDQTEYFCKTHSIDQSREKNIFKLEGQVLVIQAYDQKKTFSKIAEEFNCTREEVKLIVRNRRKIMDSFDIETASGMIKGQKVSLLEDCMFEYMQRAQFHAGACLDDDNLIGMAIKFKEVLQIKSFSINKSWLKQFQTVHLPLYLQRKNLKRGPPYSLSTRHIISFCIREYTKQSTQIMGKKSTELTETSDSATGQDELNVLRQHKIETLEKALYEYIQRSQYHRKMPLNEHLQIKIARELESILKINDFLPNKSWLKHFKLHYNINTSQRMIVVNRIPPSSLDLKDILSYCGHTYKRHEHASSKIVNAEHVNLQEVEEQKPHLQLEDQEPAEQIAVNLEVQPETEVIKMKAYTADEEDIKPDVMDIKIELTEEQEEEQVVQPACLRTSTEENEVRLITVMDNQNIDTLQTKQFSDDEVLPKVTKTYADALKKLKSLEEFSLLEENYRAIGLITQLENMFMNVIKSKNKNKKKM